MATSPQLVSIFSSFNIQPLASKVIRPIFIAATATIKIMLKNTLPAKYKALVFVIIQAILLLGLIFLSNYLGPNVYRFRYIGTVLEFIGLLGIIASAITIRSSLTVMPLPKEDGQLGTTGLYKYVRHPMYMCVLLLSLGLALASGSIIKYGLVMGLYLLFYYKSKYEEIFLSKKYAGYKEYSQNTPRFIPFLKDRSAKLKN